MTKRRIIPVTRWVIIGTLITVLSAGSTAFAATSLTAASVAPSFTTLATYHADLQRDGYTPSEKISAAQAAKFHLLWSHTAAGVISDEAAVVNGVAYWGDWKGNEHATAATGKDLWTTNLGTTTDVGCGQPVGVASSATVAKDGTTTMLWTGTGNGMVAALNASNGRVLWQTRVAPTTGGFEWSSPALYDGDIYIGVSSFGDCPLVRGKVVQLDATNGKIIHTFFTAPSNCLGAGAWASPAIDSSTNSVFIATGNAACTDPFGNAMIKLSASTLALEGSWQIPTSQNISDGDIGATPTLFSAALGGRSTPLVGVAAKNGIFYAFERSDLDKGPIWHLQVAQSGGCPECGQGSISPAAFDGHTLFAAGGASSIKGARCNGSLRAIDPATGTPIWQDCLGGAVLGPVSTIPGLVFVTDGTQVECVAASDGGRIWTFTDASGNSFFGGPVVASDVLYAGDADGTMYAFAVPPPTPKSHITTGAGLRPGGQRRGDLLLR